MQGWLAGNQLSARERLYSPLDKTGGLSWVMHGRGAVVSQGR